jgi:polar amino acid transport system substrate-binding protein
MMSTKSIALKTAAGLMLGALALTGCSSTKTEATSDNPFALKDKAKLTICSDVPYAPFEFQDSSKNIVGFDVDLANAIAKDLKVTSDIKVTAFEQIKSGSALQSGDCDVAISSISITDERKTKMLFSDPYYADDLGLMVGPGSSITTVDQAKSVKVGVQAGTTGADYAKKLGISAVEYKDSGLLIQALQTGGVQAAIGNKSTLGYSAGQDSKLKFVQDFKTGENLGVAVKLGNQKLMDEINKTLKEYTSSGELDKSKTKWFGAAAN